MPLHTGPVGLVPDGQGEDLFNLRAAKFVDSAT